MHVPLTLPDAVRRAATTFADHVAVVDGATVLTFEQLHAEVRRAAAAYVALGLEPGDRVAVWAPNSATWQVAALAASYAGGALVPLNSRYRGHEVVDILRRTDTRLLVVANGFLGRDQVSEVESAAAEAGGLPALREVIRIDDWDGLRALAERVEPADVEARADAVTPDDVADLMFTSGTTGRPKGVMTAHRQTIAAADVWRRIGDVSADDRYLLVNPYFHSFGYKAGIVVSLLTGCTAYPQATFDVAETLRLIAEERITILPGAPAIFHALFEAPGLRDTDLSSLRLAVTGAATVPVALVERMQSELSFDTVLTAFGMTECVVATMCRPGDPDELVASTCGAAVEGLELRIGDRDEILLRGPMVMLGYLDDPEATAAAIDADGWLHTGDVGRVDERGYLTITDRLKDMYISGGFNVYPAEVEQALARMDRIVEVAVVGVPDERLGEVGKAFVVRRGEGGPTEEELIAFARDRLANFKVPRAVEFVDGLPRNLAGKVLKEELRDGS